MLVRLLLRVSPEVSKAVGDVCGSSGYGSLRCPNLLRLAKTLQRNQQQELSEGALSASGHG